ncbi:hypothetical protein G6F43_005682 [Rhizopus delemar]|nr:hypothetical protein G6F43_005682 [Rhizopus delemar]
MFQLSLTGKPFLLLNPLILALVILSICKSLDEIEMSTLLLIDGLLYINSQDIQDNSGQEDHASGHCDWSQFQGGSIAYFWYVSRSKGPVLKWEYDFAVSVLSLDHLQKLEPCQKECIRRTFGSSRFSVNVMLHLVQQLSATDRVSILQAKCSRRSTDLPDDTLL